MPVKGIFFIITIAVVIAAFYYNEIYVWLCSQFGEKEKTDSNEKENEK